MTAVACTAMVGLLCVTASGGQLSKTSPGFFEVSTYATAAYRLEFNRSDMHASYDLKDFRAACGDKGCLWIEARPDRCAVAIQFGDAAEPSGMTNLYYAIRSRTREGLKQGLAETYVRQRSREDAPFVALASLVQLDVDAIACP